MRQLSSTANSSPVVKSFTCHIRSGRGQHLTHGATVMCRSNGGVFLPRAPLPTPIVSNVEGTWAYDTMSRRVKEEILGRLFEENDFLGLGMDSELQSLKTLEEELSAPESAKLDFLEDDGGPDIETWREILAPHVGKTWLDAPWVVTEFYLYRRIVGSVVGFWRTGYDPFQASKAAGLESAVASTEAISKRLNADAGLSGTEDGWRLFLETCLWGNRMDLSIWPAGSAENAQERFQEILAASEAQLLADDTPRVLEVLRGAREAGGSRMDIIVDNAGFELVTDLCLADYLLQSGAASEVVFQLKAHPTFVSDAMAKDLMETLRYLSELSEGHFPESIRAASRWLGYVERGEWLLREDLFWVQPSAMWEMPAGTRDNLRGSSLVFVKGDANYRRLLGDRHWPLDTPFEDVVSYFPAPACALRTLKAELGCGMPPHMTARAAASDPDWMVDGRWGVVHFAPACDPA
uniref:Sugar phosphate phosphatase n=1 Tax=Tetraselmis sp. GSL018 TaxID=582737 RepID=A0A061RG63_9CHLO